MFDSARTYVLEALDLPQSWKVVEEQRIPAAIERETVIVKHSRVEKLDAAPIGNLQHEVILAVFVPNRDLAKAEARLDKAVTELLGTLDGHQTINWQSAEKVVTPDGQFPGWELSLTVITEKKVKP